MLVVIISYIFCLERFFSYLFALIGAVQYSGEGTVRELQRHPDKEEVLCVRRQKRRTTVRSIVAVALEYLYS